MPRTPRGFSLTEAMVAVVVMALAIMPLLTSGTTIHRQSHFAEHHMLALARAKCLLDLTCGLDFALLDWIASKDPAGAAGDPVVIDLEKLLEPGALDLLFGVVPGASETAAYEAKLDRVGQEVTWVRRGRDLGEVRVRVSWSYGGDRPGQKEHAILLARLVRRPESSMLGRGGAGP